MPSALPRFVDLTERGAAGESRFPVLQAVAGLMILNLVMAWALDGQLAWQTHLGGFVAGWITAWAMPAGDPAGRPRGPATDKRRDG